MSYGDRVIHNVVTGTTDTIPVTDSWVLENKPERLELSTDKTEITADGTDTAVVTVQRTTPILTGGNTQNVAQAGTVKIMVDDQETDVTLDEYGRGTVNVTTVETGVFEVYPLGKPGNTLEIEGV